MSRTSRLPLSDSYDFFLFYRIASRVVILNLFWSLTLICFLFIFHLVIIYFPCECMLIFQITYRLMYILLLNYNAKNEFKHINRKKQPYYHLLKTSNQKALMISLQFNTITKNIYYYFLLLVFEIYCQGYECKAPEDLLNILHLEYFYLKPYEI